MGSRLGRKPKLRHEKQRAGGQQPRARRGARRQAAIALGRDPDQRDPFIEPPKSGATPTPKIPAISGEPVASRGIGVLSIGEAAARVGISRTQLESLIDRGAAQALPTGFTRMIPTAEVDRLQELQRTR